MHPGVQRKLFGFALLGAVAAANAGGLRISRQRRHTEFYQAFYAALEKAVAHYEGCIAATATAIRFSPSIESATVRAMLRERPPFTLSNMGELYCDVEVRVDLDRPEFLIVTVTGPAKVVTYLKHRLLIESTLSFSTGTGMCPPEGSYIVTIDIHLFNEDDPNLHLIWQRL